MPGEVLDYIAATLGLLLVFLIITSSFLFMTAPVLNYTVMRDRVVVASNMLDSLLFSPGAPEGWGLNSFVLPEVFGLAQERAPVYYVDAFKLMRITEFTQFTITMCEDLSYWSGTSLSLDTDSVEGNYSVKDSVNSPIQGQSYETTYNPPGSWDLSAKVLLSFSVKSNDASQQFTSARVYIYDKSGNWRYWNLDFAGQDKWTECKVLLATWDGQSEASPNLEAVDKIVWSFVAKGTKAFYKAIDCVACPHPVFPYLWNLGYIDFSSTKRILGITRLHTFQIIFRPAMKIKATERSNDTDPYALFDIDVRGGTGPVPNASVNGTFIAAQPVGPPWGASPPQVIFNLASSVTDETGHTTLNFTLPLGRATGQLEPSTWEYIKNSYALIVRASLGGIRGVGYHVPSAASVTPLLKFYINGSTVIVGHPRGEGQEQDKRYYNITYSVPFPSFSVEQIASDWVNRGLNETSPAIVMIPGMLCIGVDEVGLGNKPPAVYIVPWGVGALGLTVVYGDPWEGQGPVVTVERVVIVGEETYIATMAFWSREPRTIYPTPGTPTW